MHTTSSTASKRSIANSNILFWFVGQLNEEVALNLLASICAVRRTTVAYVEQCHVFPTFMDYWPSPHWKQMDKRLNGPQENMAHLLCEIFAHMRMSVPHFPSNLECLQDILIPHCVLEIWDWIRRCTTQFKMPRNLSHTHFKCPCMWFYWERYCLFYSTENPFHDFDTQILPRLLDKGVKRGKSCSNFWSRVLVWQMNQLTITVSGFEGIWRKHFTRSLSSSPTFVFVWSWHGFFGSSGIFVVEFFFFQLLRHICPFTISSLQSRSFYSFARFGQGESNISHSENLLVASDFGHVGENFIEKLDIRRIHKTINHFFFGSAHSRHRTMGV